jgi:cytochrome b involved in lipid metabolism
MTDNLKEISFEELQKRDGKEGRDLWVLVDGKIYDMTTYDHPGGKDVLHQNDPESYVDKYEEFMEVGHSPTAERLMKKFIIGKLQEE